MTQSERFFGCLLGNSIYSSKNKIISKKWIGSLSLLLILPLVTGKVILIQPANAQNSPKQQLSQEANILYVDSKQGSDRQGNGSKESPLKTITQALKVAQPNTFIYLNPGTYSEQTGESFPLIIRNSVTIQGSPSSKGYNVVINGSGDFISPTGAGQQVTIAATKEAKGITGVTVINPHTRGHGLWIESASPQVISNSFIRNGNTGLSVNGKSNPIIKDNYFSRNGGNGLLIYGTSKPQVENNEFDNTGFGVSIVENAAPILRSNSFSSNRIGIILEGNAQAVLRDNEITNSLEYGLVAIAQSRVDLGTVTQPGNNIFRSNKKLDIQNATPNLITAVGTEINGYTEGNIDFRGTANAPIAAKPPELKPLKPLSSLPPRTTDISRRSSQPLPIPEVVNRDNNTLPSPKIITSPPSPSSSSSPPPLPSSPPSPSSAKETNEFIFTAPPPLSTPSTSSPTVEFRSSTGTTYVDRAKLPVPSVPQYSPQIQPSTLKQSPQNIQITSLSDVLGGTSTANANTSTTKYRVIAEATNDNQKTRVRSLYPDAFTTIYQGKSMLQIGVFSNRNTAENVLQSLEKIGVYGVILN